MPPGNKVFIGLGAMPVFVGLVGASMLFIRSEYMLFVPVPVPVVPVEGPGIPDIILKRSMGPPEPPVVPKPLLGVVPVGLGPAPPAAREFIIDPITEENGLVGAVFVPAMVLTEPVGGGIGMLLLRKPPPEVAKGLGMGGGCCCLRWELIMAISGNIISGCSIISPPPIAFMRIIIIMGSIVCGLGVGRTGKPILGGKPPAPPGPGGGNEPGGNISSGLGPVPVGLIGSDPIGAFPIGLVPVGPIEVGPVAVGPPIMVSRSFISTEGPTVMPARGFAVGSIPAITS